MSHQHAVDVFEHERGRLQAIAYRMLGSYADAEDAVQDAWLRWQRLGEHGQAAVERPAAWMTTTVSRLALDRLKSAQRQREQYVGPWLPEPLLTAADPADTVELTESLTLGFLTVLERLAPVDRAVFLLVDVFGESYADVAAVVGRSEESCRQIAHRARQRVRDERRSGGSPSAHADALVGAFLQACVQGDVGGLRRILTDDVVVVSDGGEHVHAARRPVVGVERVGRLLTNLTGRMPADATVVPHDVNGEPGFVVTRDDQPWFVVALETREQRISAVRIMLNPTKLRHIVVPA